MAEFRPYIVVLVIISTISSKIMPHYHYSLSDPQNGTNFAAENENQSAKQPLETKIYLSDMLPTQAMFSHRTNHTNNKKERL